MTPQIVEYPNIRKRRKLNDLTGKVYGRLTVIGFHGYAKHNSTIWLCRCECGKETLVQQSNLVGGGVKSCGCLLREVIHLKRKPRPDIHLGLGVASRNFVINTYKTRARLRGHVWSLTLDQAEDLFQTKCHYCGCDPAHRSRRKYNHGDYIYNGIDRVDSSKGYEPGNVVTCCKRCNVAKNDQSYEEFYAWIDRVHANLHAKECSHAMDRKGRS